MLVILWCNIKNPCKCYILTREKERKKEMFYLMTHSTHFIYGYMVSDIWLRTILIVRKETHCCHIGYSYRLAARVLLYAPSHRQDNTYHGLCYTSRGALAGMRNSSMGPPHEGSIRRPTAPWANALPLSYVPLRQERMHQYHEIKLSNPINYYFIRISFASNLNNLWSTLVILLLTPNTRVASLKLKWIQIIQSYQLLDNLYYLNIL